MQRVAAWMWACLVAHGLLAPGAQAQALFADGFEIPGPPAPGAIVFTEVMSNPNQVPDASGEWFELANVGARAIDLRGCTLQANSGSFTLEPSLALAPGALAVFARVLEPGNNGNVAADAAFGFPLASTDLLSLICTQTLIDAIDWQNETAGRSRSLDRDAWDAAANDLDANWCLSVASYNGTDTGTPGSTDQDCGGAVTFPPPGAGEVRITELMVDPAGALTDASAEWIELESLAAATVALDGCTLGTLSASNVLPLLSFGPGERLLLARSASTELNGGLVVDATVSFTLTNAGATVELRCGDVLIDQVTYATSSAGRSLVRGAGATLCIAPAGTTEYFTGNFGTPAQPNLPACAP
jgi:hypothetical protein